MLLAYRLVRLIETHADKLADSALKLLQDSEKTRDFTGPRARISAKRSARSIPILANG